MHASQVILISIFTSALTSGGTVYLMQRLKLVDMAPAQAQAQAEPKNAAEVVVPNLLGLSEADARANLTTSGFVTWVGAPKPSDRVKPDLVAEQVPVAGLPLKKGSTVTISLAAPLPEVPELVGKSEDEAKAALKKEGFQAEIGEPIPDSSIEKGMVAGQHPEAGEEASPGSKVVLRLSSGPEPVAVPKVIGLNIASAKKNLKEAGLELGAVRWVYDEDLFSGAIVRQDPAANEKIPPGTKVSISVNRDY